MVFVGPGNGGIGNSYGQAAAWNLRYRVQGSGFRGKLNIFCV